ncbi:MAG TPA: hypothetical protein VN661_05300 [Candidatus Acidoferrales bacterium]|nr:hypothetical protein [Candidatus Acidoferrales bacterium]
MPGYIRCKILDSSFAFTTLVAAFAGLFMLAPSLRAQVSSTPGIAILAPGTTKTFTIQVQPGTNFAKFSVVTLGAPNLDFTEVASGTTCPTLTAGSCTIEVQFQPKVAGRRQGAALLTDASGNTLLSISLDGAGSGPMPAFAPSTISTFAGGGTGGDGGPATSAQLVLPMGIATDGFGNVYIADQKANTVRKVTPAGIISTFAGTGTAGYAGDGGPAASAELNGPMDVAVDGAGFVYISDTNNNVVRMVDNRGIITTYAGQYYAPGTTPPPVCAAATDSVGDGCPGNQMTLNMPVGLVFCHAQNLHIADKLDNRVRTVNRIGYNTYTQVGDGVGGYNGDGELNTSAHLNGPTGLDFDAANYIYVADSGNHIVRKTLLTGTTPNPIATIAGTPGMAGNTGDGGAATSAQLNDPFGVKVDPAGDLYVADYASQVVREVNVASGIISTIAGTSTAGFSGNGGAATSAQLNNPAKVTLDEKGNLLVVDSQNGVVREVDLSDAPSLTFAATAAGATSPAQDVTIMNAGDLPLNISQIGTVAGYSLQGPDTSCSLSGSESLAAATSCVLGIEFTPTTAGTIGGGIVLTDNATPPSQTIVLSGNASSAAATYTVAAQSPTVLMAPGTNGTATLMLKSSNYAGTVSFTTSVSSSNGTPADVTATASPVALTAGGSGTSTVTITANAQATNAPAKPWSGGALFFAALIGLPFIFRRKRATNLILCVLAISLGGSLLVACGSKMTAKQTYAVTVTPKASAMGTAAVTNPSPVTITVTVQ